MARFEFHELNTALIAYSSCLYGSWGKSIPVSRLTTALNSSVSFAKSSAVSSVSSLTPFFALNSLSTSSKASSSTPSTTLPNICTKRLYASATKRGFPVSSTMPLAVSSFKPIFKTVSIMPGIENLAPERQETNNGFLGSPKTLPVAPSITFIAAKT